MAARRSGCSAGLGRRRRRVVITGSSPPLCVVAKWDCPVWRAFYSPPPSLQQAGGARSFCCAVLASTAHTHARMHCRGRCCSMHCCSAAAAVAVWPVADAAASAPASAMCCGLLAAAMSALLSGNRARRASERWPPRDPCVMLCRCCAADRVARARAPGPSAIGRLET